MIHRLGFVTVSCLLSLILALVATPGEQAHQGDRDSLLRRTRSTQIESARFLEGLYASEESLLLPANDRLVAVFLKQDRDVAALLHEVELRIDNQIAKVYSHEIGDLEKLLNGGVIPLYSTLLSVGKHTIDVRITGMASDDDGPAVETFTFFNGNRSHFIEIRITQDGIKFGEWR